MSEKKQINGKAAASAVVAVTAAGVLVGGAFSSPDDILDEGPGPLVQTLNTDAPAADDGGTAEEEEVGVEEERRGLRGGVRRLVRSAPLRVRALVFVPLWALGTGVMTLFSALWSALLSPVASAVLNWLIIAAIAVGVFALAAKTVFPDLPLKKILNKHSLLTIALLCLGFCLLDALLPVFWDSYETASRAFKLFGSFVAAGVPLVFFVSRRKRRMLAEVEGEPVEPEAPELSLAEREAAAQKLVQELADSVSPRLH